VCAALADDIARDPAAGRNPLVLDPAARPHVVLVVGERQLVHSAIIAKSPSFKREGKKVLLVAGDTSAPPSSSSRCGASVPRFRLSPGGWRRCRGLVTKASRSAPKGA
jgi:hypothetical protein